MNHSVDFTIDDEQFIRENLSFLIESDDEFSENSENSSTRFRSYEECSKCDFFYIIKIYIF